MDGMTQRDNWMRVAGVVTVALIWFALQPRSEAFGGLDGNLVANIAMAVFLVVAFGGDYVRDRMTPAGSLFVQSVAAMAANAVAPGSVAPILVIVIVAQLVFLYRGVQALTVVLALNGTLFLIMIGIWRLQWFDALMTVCLYGSFQAFSLLLASYARAAEDARNELKEVNAELLATRSLLVEAARDRERLRLSRELHDVAGHTLTALKLNLRGLAHDSEGDTRETAERSFELADGLLDDIRALVGNFRENDGFAVDGALRDLTAPFDEPVFELAVGEHAAIPDFDVARTLVGVAREAITNVVRHADATHCRVALESDAGHFRLVVEDDGEGIGEAPPGQGLRGMTERLRALGGSLEIGKRPGGGTRLVATLGAGG
ncbi:MAG: sensor histidine kinase [Pseudomonadota bacterium]